MNTVSCFWVLNCRTVKSHRALLCTLSVVAQRSARRCWRNRPSSWAARRAAAVTGRRVGGCEPAGISHHRCEGVFQLELPEHSGASVQATGSPLCRQDGPAAQTASWADVIQFHHSSMFLTAEQNVSVKLEKVSVSSPADAWWKRCYGLKQAPWRDGVLSRHWPVFEGKITKGRRCFDMLWFNLALFI